MPGPNFSIFSWPRPWMVLAVRGFAGGRGRCCGGWWRRGRRRGGGLVFRTRLCATRGGGGRGLVARGWGCLGWVWWGGERARILARLRKKGGFSPLRSASVEMTLLHYPEYD